MQASSQAIRQIRDATALDSMLVERRNADPADSVQGSSVPASEALCAAFARSFLRDIGTQSPLSRITRLCADAAQKIPCLKEMVRPSTRNHYTNSEADKNVPIQTKDFVKFLGIVIILFCGFLTTFTMLARGEFSARQMLWTMINVSRQPTGYTRLQS
jgi:hypothetical protein